jgi:hypothetical protein
MKIWILKRELRRNYEFLTMNMKKLYKIKEKRKS